MGACASVACLLCLRICGKCRAAFRHAACGASALLSPRSPIARLPSGASSLRLHRHPRAVRLGSRHFPRLHVCMLRISVRLHFATAHPPSSATRHPSAATVRLAWSRCLPSPIAPSRRCLPHRGGVSALAPWQSHLSLARYASRIPVPSLRRKRPLAPWMSQWRALRTNGFIPRVVGLVGQVRPV